MNATDAGILGPAFDQLWPALGEVSQFEPLLQAIDEVVLREACHARIARFHRALERHYPN